MQLISLIDSLNAGWKWSLVWGWALAWDNIVNVLWVLLFKFYKVGFRTAIGFRDTL